MSTEVKMLTIPPCDIHAAAIVPQAIPAAYDAKTTMGPWAYMCQACFDKYGPGQLGTGYGQRLIPARPEPVKDVPGRGRAEPPRGPVVKLRRQRSG